MSQPNLDELIAICSPNQKTGLLSLSPEDARRLIAAFGPLARDHQSAMKLVARLREILATELFDVNEHDIPIVIENRLARELSAILAELAASPPSPAPPAET